jgi:hypothetical protein
MERSTKKGIGIFSGLVMCLGFAIVFFDSWKRGHGTYKMVSICGAGEIMSLFLLVHRIRDRK